MKKSQLEKKNFPDCPVKDKEGRWGWLIFIILVSIFFLSFLIRLKTVDEPFLLRYDPFYWYHQGEVLLSGEKPEYDTLVTTPTPPKFEPGFLSYLSVYSYKFINLFLSQLTFFRFCFWFSALLPALSVFPIYFIGKQLLNPLAGILGAFFFNFSPYFVARNMAGFFDTDPLNIFFVSLIIALIITGLSKIEENNHKAKKPLIYSFLGGVASGFFAWTWNGGYWMILWIILSSAILCLGIRLIFQKRFTPLDSKHLTGFKEKQRTNRSWVKSYLIFYSVFILISLTAIIFLAGPGNLTSIALGPLYFFKISSGETALSSDGNSLFPSTTSTVTELRNPENLSEMANQIGPSGFFLGILGLLMILYLFFNPSPSAKGEGSKKDFYFLLLLVWTIVTLIANLSAIKYYQYFAMPITILAGFALAQVWELTFHNKEFKKEKTTFLFVAFSLFILTSFSLYLTIFLAQKQSSLIKTSISENWADSLHFLRDKTPNDSIVVTWWPQGYWTQAIAKRKTIIDGGTQHAILSIPLAEISKEECQQRKGYIAKKFENSDTNPNTCVVSRIQDISTVLFTKEPETAKKILKDYCGTRQNNKNCEIYLVLSEELIYKSRYWTYFATWEREKAEGKTSVYETKQNEQGKIDVSAPEELTESLFTKLYLLKEDVPGFELAYENPTIKIYKVF